MDEASMSEVRYGYFKAIKVIVSIELIPNLGQPGKG